MSTDTKWRTDKPSEDGQYIAKIYGGFLLRVWYSKFYDEWDIKGGEKAIDAWLPIESEDDVIAVLEDIIQRLFDIEMLFRDNAYRSLDIVVCSTNKDAKHGRKKFPDGTDIDRAKGGTCTKSIVLPCELYGDIESMISKKRLEYAEKLKQHIYSIP